MASLGRLTGGGREGWRIRFSVMRQRKSLTLSRVSEATAKIWCKNIQHMAKCIDAKVARDDSVTEWIATLTAEQLDKLHAAGLIAQGSKPQAEVKVVLLGEFLEGALSDRQSSIKRRTYIALRTVADRLIEYFGATRILATIRNEDARKFRTWLESANKRDKPKKSDDGAVVQPKLLRKYSPKHLLPAGGLFSCWLAKRHFEFPVKQPNYDGRTLTGAQIVSWFAAPRQSITKVASRVSFLCSTIWQQR